MLPMDGIIVEEERMEKEREKRMRRKRSDEKINKVSYQKRIPSFVKNRNN